MRKMSVRPIQFSSRQNGSKSAFKRIFRGATNKRFRYATKSKKCPPPRPPSGKQNSSITGKIKRVNMQNCHRNTKTSYHLTGKSYKVLINNKLGTGKMKKNILPDLTGSYRELHQKDLTCK